MKRIVIFAMLFVWSALAAVSQKGGTGEGPLVSLFLPRGYPSEKVQVVYFLSGPFGGYGGFVQPELDRQTVDFRAAVDGKPADRIKIIAHLPGCEIITFDFALEGTATWRQIECKSLTTIMLHGRIPKSYIGKETEVGVSYLSDWAHKFFGIADGMGTTFTIARIVPKDSGEFTVAVPDFYRQNLGSGNYVLDLRCRNCENLPGPGIMGRTYRELPLSSSYPPLIEFSGDAPN
jgi:hypothetical protein